VFLFESRSIPRTVNCMSDACMDNYSNEVGLNKSHRYNFTNIHKHVTARCAFFLVVIKTVCMVRWFSVNEEPSCGRL